MRVRFCTFLKPLVLLLDCKLMEKYQSTVLVAVDKRPCLTGYVNSLLFKHITTVFLKKKSYDKSEVKQIIKIWPEEQTQQKDA